MKITKNETNLQMFKVTINSRISCNNNLHGIKNVRKQIFMQVILFFLTHYLARIRYFKVLYNCTLFSIYSTIKRTHLHL